MVIKKVYNNNVVLAGNAAGRDCVLIGRGLAFGKRPGDTVDITSEVRVFRPMNKGIAEKLSTIIDTIPVEIASVSDEIIAVARKELGKLDDKIYLTLLEHLSFAIGRSDEGLEFVDSFWEIRRLYPKEYDVGEKALDIIEKRMGVRLPKCEASFIAFHFVNANSVTTRETGDTLKMIRNTLNIVKECFRIEYDEDSLAYNRFITHLRFFAGSVFAVREGGREDEQENEALGKLLAELAEENRCVDRISDYLKTEFGYEMTKNERGYLIAHINNIVNRTQKKK